MSEKALPAPAAAPVRGVNRRVLGVGAALVLPLVGILLLNLGRDPSQVRSPLIGREAPAFTLAPAGGGAPVSLPDLRGTPVVVNFWATWCAPCLEEHGTLTRGAREAAGRARFLGVIYGDEEATVLDFLGQRGSAYPSLVDPGGKTAIAYGVYGVPETYFIDAQGKVVAKYVGPLNDEQLRAHLQLAGVR